MHLTGGSTTVPDSYDRPRAAGALARETLKEAAARRLGVDRTRLWTEDRAVIGPSGASLPCAELAPEAALLEPITAEPRDPSAWKRLGRPMRRTDIVAKSTGTQLYGGDMRLDGMLHATVVTNPIPGGSVASFDATEALAMRGVSDVLTITTGRAVLPDNNWRAMKAAWALRIDRGGMARTPATTDELWQAHADAFLEDNRDSRFADDGDVDADLYAAGTAVAAEYRAPFLHHAPMEPANATILHTPERTDVWTATQIPTFLRDSVAEIAGQDAERVHVHNLPFGGSFGHRLEDLWVRQTAEIAVQRPGTPIPDLAPRSSMDGVADLSHSI